MKKYKNRVRKKYKRSGKIPTHRKVYIDKYGPIPDGWHVHHVDFNTLNNELDNLLAMPGYAHEALHDHLYKNKVRYTKEETITWVDRHIRAANPTAKQKSEEATTDYIKLLNEYKALKGRLREVRKSLREHKDVVDRYNPRFATSFEEQVYWNITTERLKKLGLVKARA